MTKIINLTPHDVIVNDELGNVIRTYEASGKVARVRMGRVKQGEVDGITINKTQTGKVFDMPKKETGTYYIVSRVVAVALPQRHDLIYPDELIKDSSGKVLGCKSFGMV